jgi:hypothetical protein
MDGLNYQIVTPILFRGIERLIICGGAIFAIYLGYKLYCFGVSDGLSKVHFKSKLVSFAASGSGPGLFLICFGSLVLIMALWIGQGEWEGWEKRGAGSLLRKADIPESHRKFINELKSSKEQKKNDLPGDERAGRQKEGVDQRDGIESPSPANGKPPR